MESLKERYNLERTFREYSVNKAQTEKVDKIINNFYADFQASKNITASDFENEILEISDGNNKMYYKFCEDILISYILDKEDEKYIQLLKILYPQRIKDDTDLIKSINKIAMK